MSINKGLIGLHLTTHLSLLMFKDHCLRQEFPRKYFEEKIDEWEKKFLEEVGNEFREDGDILQALKIIKGELMETELPEKREEL